jgi:hypothetical protein
LIFCYPFFQRLAHKARTRLAPLFIYFYSHLFVQRLAQGKDEVNALYELFEQKLHEQDQSLRALLRTLPPTHELSHPPADTTTTATAQQQDDAHMHKAGAGTNGSVGGGGVRDGGVGGGQEVENLRKEVMEMLKSFKDSIRRELKVCVCMYMCVVMYMCRVIYVVMM